MAWAEVHATSAMIESESDEVLVPLDPVYDEQAIYTVAGEVEIAGATR